MPFPVANIRTACKKKNITLKELEEALGFGNGVIARWETAKTSPPIDRVIAISSYLNISIGELCGYDEDITINTLPPDAIEIARSYANLSTHDQHMVRAVVDCAARETPKKKGQIISMPKAMRRKDGFLEIDVYDEPAAAGLGNYLDVPITSREQYPEWEVPEGIDFGIRISGESMEPEIIDGATVFVKAMPAIENGQIGIFVVNGESYCKRLKISAGQVRLVSENTAKENRKRKYADIILKETDEFRTIGLVLGQYVP